MTKTESTAHPQSDPFIRFCEMAEQVGATAKRLEKSALLGVYFTTLSDDDLVLAARYAAGILFPLRDGRTSNIGGAALLAVVQEVTGLDETHLREQVVVWGDWGDAAGEAWHASAETQKNASSGRTLAEVATFFDELAETGGSLKKRESIVGFLRELSALEAKYIIKLLQNDLRIGLKEGAVEDAIARTAGESVDAIQYANMLTGDIGEAALLARHGRLGQAQMRLFHPIKFMLATPAADLADVARQMPGEFAVEDKFDGIRAQAHISAEDEYMGNDDLHGVVEGNRRVALFSRTLDEITGAFPDLVASLGDLVTSGGLILDGEIVPVRGGEILPFQELQKRLGRKKPTAAILEEVPVAFVVYDVLYSEDRVVLAEPYTVRRAALDALPIAEEIGQGKVRRALSLRFTEVVKLDDEFDAARLRGNEGLMVKDLASPYKPGRRGRDWLKIKRALATLDVVVTAVEVGNGRRRHLLSDYTFAVRASEDDPTLLNVGKAYSGLTDAELAEMSEWFKAHTLQEFAHGKVRTVEPQIVIEVTFDRVQPSARHKSGYALRFPRIVRLREDKPVEQIDTLETVARLAQS
jgi:DNA ligase-1